MSTERPAGKRVMIVMEAGGDWPEGLDEFRPALRDGYVLVQGEDESLDHFAEHVVDDCRGLLSIDHRLDLAVIACSQRSDDSALSHRRAIARSLLSALDRNQGRLLFTAAERSHGRARRALADLAAEFADELSESRVSVGLRFGGARRVA